MFKKIGPENTIYNSSLEQLKEVQKIGQKPEEAGDQLKSGLDKVTGSMSGFENLLGKVDDLASELESHQDAANLSQESLQQATEKMDMDYMNKINYIFRYGGGDMSKVEDMAKTFKLEAGWQDKVKEMVPKLAEKGLVSREFLDNAVQTGLYTKEQAQELSKDNDLGFGNSFEDFIKKEVKTEGKEITKDVFDTLPDFTKQAWIEKYYEAQKEFGIQSKTDYASRVGEVLGYDAKTGAKLEEKQVIAESDAASAQMTQTQAEGGDLETEPAAADTKAETKEEYSELDEKYHKKLEEVIDSFNETSKKSLLEFEAKNEGNYGVKELFAKASKDGFGDYFKETGVDGVIDLVNSMGLEEGEAKRLLQVMGDYHGIDMAKYLEEKEKTVADAPDAPGEQQENYAPAPEDDYVSGPDDSTTGQGPDAGGPQPVAEYNGQKFYQQTDSKGKVFYASEDGNTTYIPNNEGGGGQVYHEGQKVGDVSAEEEQQAMSAYNEQQG